MPVMLYFSVSDEDRVDDNVASTELLMRSVHELAWVARRREAKVDVAPENLSKEERRSH